VSLDGSEILRPLRDLEWDIALLDAGFTVHGNQTRPVGRVLEGPGGSSDVGGSGGRGVGSSQRARDGGDDSRKHGWEERRNGVGGDLSKRLLQKENGFDLSLFVTNVDELSKGSTVCSVPDDGYRG